MAISAYVIAAICGCWCWESGVNPGVWESLIVCAWDYVYGDDGPNKGGYGLGQWTNTRNSVTQVVGWRNLNRHNWMVANGYSDDSGEGQIQYMIYEQHWASANSVMGYTSLNDFLNSTSTDLNLLVQEFLACWEGVPGNQLITRQQYARQIYQYITDHWSDDPTTYQWVSGNFYSSWAQRYNNAMCVYFSLIGTPVPPGTGPGSGNIWGGIRDVLRRLIIHA